MIHKTKKEEGKKHKTKYKTKKKTQKKQQIFRIKLKNDRFRMFGPHSKLISAVLAWFKTDFGNFDMFRSLAHMTRFGWYGLILAESGRFDAKRSRVSVNQAKSAWIHEKKKKLRCGTDARATASDATPRVGLCRTSMWHPPNRVRAS